MHKYFPGRFHILIPPRPQQQFGTTREYTPPPRTPYPPLNSFIYCCNCLLLATYTPYRYILIIDYMMATPNAGLCGRWPWASGASVDPLLDGYGTNFDEMQQDANETFTAAVQRIWQRPAAHGSVAKDLPRLARRVTVRTRTGRWAMKS